MSTDTDDTTQIAIACQGGGSHTAFTAGALKHLLDELDNQSYNIVGLSGTSGGAVCATAVWYGLLTGGTDEAVKTLEGVWQDISARDIDDRIVNEWTVMMAKFTERGLPMPQFSPYDPWMRPVTSIGRDRFLGDLKNHIKFDEARKRVAEIKENSGQDQDLIDLIVGAADVTEGEFKTFRNEEVTAEAVLASAAIPILFEAVEVENHWYWDGLFSQNPPIRDFLRIPDSAEEKPDEIWIIKINPKYRDEVPESYEEIFARRNELAGNLSLRQEIYFIEQINDLIKAGQLPDEYKKVGVEFIELAGDLPTSSKFNRDPDFIKMLMGRGDRRARRFLRQRE